MTKLIPLLSLSVLAACSTEDTDPTPVDDGADDVMEIAIRRLNDGQDVAEFEAAREAFVSKLRSQPGVLVDREFSSFFDFNTFSAPTPPVFIGMTQYEDEAAFTAAGAALGASPEAGAFFSKFKPEVFTLVVPSSAEARVDLAGMAATDGQVIEVVWRDLAKYEGSDAATYEAKRDAALAVLGEVDGVEAEYQWVATEGTLAIGMTVYASQQRFFEIASDEELLANPDIAAFFGGYPSLGGYVSTSVR